MRRRLRRRDQFDRVAFERRRLFNLFRTGHEQFVELAIGKRFAPHLEEFHAVFVGRSAFQIDRVELFLYRPDGFRRNAHFIGHCTDDAFLFRRDFVSHILDFGAQIDHRRMLFAETGIEFGGPADQGCFLHAQPLDRLGILHFGR